MNFSYPLAVLCATASLFGCASSSDHSVNLPLAATQQNMGQIATTTLTNVNNQTNFDFYISGIPDGTTLPLRIYTFIHKGSCQQPGPVAYAMNDKVNTDNAASTRGWSFYRSAPIPLQDLLAGKYAIVVRTAPEDGNIAIFCGDVAQATK
ncbi:hypothetical protein D9M71_117530 [compost metagenome]